MHASHRIQSNAPLRGVPEKTPPRDGVLKVSRQPERLEIIGVAAAGGSRSEGCAAGPEVLHRRGLVGDLEDRGLPARWGFAACPSVRTAAGAHLQLYAAFLEEVAARVRKRVRQGDWFGVIGGDHACAIGTWSGAAAALAHRGPLGLVWVDAHMDGHTPQTSPSGALHGMPVAVLLGYGERVLTALQGGGAKVAPRNLCLLGVRSYEDGEARLLRRLGVRVISMVEVRRRGVAAAWAEAVAIASRGTAGFGVSVDLDAVDPNDAPGVDVPVAGGLAGQDLVDCVSAVAHRPGFLGLEVAELNPRRDVRGKTARLAEHLFIAAFCGGREEHRGPGH